MSSSALVLIIASIAGQAGSMRLEPPSPLGIGMVAVDFNGLGVSCLLESKAVQVELKFSDEDRSNLPSIRKELGGRDKESFVAKLWASEKELDEFVRTLIERSRKIDEFLKELLGAARFQRFKEIRRQALGISASLTADEEARTAIALTRFQKETLNAKRKELKKTIVDLAILNNGGDPKLPPPMLDKAAAEYFEKEQVLFMQVWTDLQREAWAKQIGAPFKVPDSIKRQVRRGRFDPLPPLKEGIKKAPARKGGEKPAPPKRDEKKVQPNQ